MRSGLVPMRVLLLCASAVLLLEGAPTVAASQGELPRAPVSAAVALVSPYQGGIPGMGRQGFGARLVSFAQPVERRLGVGARRLLRTVSQRIRRMYRLVLWVVGRWAKWTGEAVLFTVIAFVAPVLNRDLFRTWRVYGLWAFFRAGGVALLVYLRLLVDRRTPAVGKFLLFFAVAYGVAPADLIPDRFGPLGLVDDVLLLMLTSRTFVRTCDDKLVVEHAMHVAGTFERRRKRRRSGQEEGDADEGRARTV